MTIGLSTRSLARKNHHLWLNHGRWFLHLTVHPSRFTSERIRRTLGTSDLTEARRRRDRIIAALQAGKPIPAFS